MRSLHLSLLLFVLIATASSAQTDRPMPAQWSIRIDAGYNIPVSSTMRATGAEFKEEARNDYAPSRYPFGDSRARSFRAGGEIAYRFEESGMGAYGAFGRTNFFVDDDEGNEAQIWVWSGTLGGEYSIGTFEDRVSGYGRLGLNASMIGGRVYYHFFTTDIESAMRLGFEAETGARLNVGVIPLSIEAAVNYTNANLVGKTFQMPTSKPGGFLEVVGPNDGTDPNDAGDGSRTIDFATLRLGLRWRF
jgi:hypothetical protein